MYRVRRASTWVASALAAWLLASFAAVPIHACAFDARPADASHHAMCPHCRQAGGRDHKCPMHAPDDRGDGRLGGCPPPSTSLLTPLGVGVLPPPVAVPAPAVAATPPPPLSRFPSDVAPLPESPPPRA
jgi:hypothetical protein